MFRKSFKNFIFSLIILGAIISFVKVVFATTTSFDLQYPEFVDPEKTKTPAEFLNKFYIYALGISGTLAVMMIVYGGIRYAVNPGNASQQSEALDIIKSAVFGIILLAGAYLILETINPSLVILKNPGMKEVVLKTPTTATPPGPGGVDSNQLTHNGAVTILNRFGINYSSSGGCSDPKNPRCTSFEGFPKGAMCKLIEMHSKGAGDMRITAGTETGHKEHGSGKPMVDLSFSNFVGQTDNYILKQIGKTKDEVLANPNNFSNRYRGNDNNTYVFETAGTGKHWHVRLQLVNEVKGFQVSKFSEGDPSWQYCKE